MATGIAHTAQFTQDGIKKECAKATTEIDSVFDTCGKRTIRFI